MVLSPTCVKPLKIALNAWIGTIRAELRTRVTPCTHYPTFCRWAWVRGKIITHAYSYPHFLSGMPDQNRILSLVGILTHTLTFCRAHPTRIG